MSEPIGPPTLMGEQTPVVVEAMRHLETALATEGSTITFVLIRSPGGRIGFLILDAGPYEFAFAARCMQALVDAGVMVKSPKPGQA